MICLFGILAVGYLLGRITIKGISLGSAGVFIMALLFGAFLYNDMGAAVPNAADALKIIENLGLMFFVTAVGFIAGPSFVANFKKNFKSYVLLGAIIIIAGAAGCVGCIYVERLISGIPAEEYGELTATMVGVLAGSLTSTPAFSASKGAVSESLQDAVSAGYAIAYLFGVVGVVLFVQLIPKLTKANVAEERSKIAAIDTGKSGASEKKLIEMDDFGLMPLALAIVIGIVVGSLKFGNFSLTTTGGCLLAGLVFGHFGHIGPVSIMPKATTLKALRELGLVFFLAGAGVKGGSSFVAYFKPIYFVYGIVITLVPMVIGFLFAKYVLKLPLFNNLGSLTGGMTSTPALGTLINVAGTEDVANAYAATYPVALIAVVLASQLIIMFFS
ncbi:MAG: permease [Clostridia bacterium]|nr:permease [Clostridia bacterium]